MSRNVETVQQAYAAFGRGDVEGILATLDDAIEWHGVKGAEGVAPHAGLRRGKPAVAEFFAQLAGSLDFHRFQPLEFVDGGDTVAVIGEYEATAKTTGRRMASDWVMVFTFRAGKIVQFREWTDSAQLVRLYGAAAGV